MGATIKMVDGSEILILESLEDIISVQPLLTLWKVTEQLGSKRDGFTGTRTTIINSDNIIKIY